MLECIAILSAGPVHDEATVRGVLERAANVAGTQFARYDLNQMEHWRTFDLDRAVIDALTQRTQMFRAEGLGLFYFALGKHGEPPTAILRADAELEAIDIEAWFDIDRVEELRVSTSAWSLRHPHTPQRHAWRQPPAGVDAKRLRNAWWKENP